MSGIEDMGDSEDGRMLDSESPTGHGSESAPPNWNDLPVGVVPMDQDEEGKSTQPQVGFQFAGGGDDAARLGTDYDVLSPSLQDCWPIIFDYLSDPKSWTAVSNTCRFFNSLMKSRMAELAIPILLRNVKLERPIILALRQVSQQSKASVDELLFESKPQWLTERFFLWNPEDMQKFGRDFAPALQGTLASEFLTLRVEHLPQYESALELVTNHGASIRGIQLSLDVERFPVLYERLTPLLSKLPNVVTLKLFFEKGKNFHLDSGAGQLDPNILPELHLLKNLRLFFADSYFSTNRLEVLVQRYGLQLDSFECCAMAFSQMHRETCNSLSNLLQLRVLRIYPNNYAKDVFEFLAQIPLPKLERLFLKGNSYAGDFLKVITNFRGSLKELDISRLELDMERNLKDMKPGDLMQCPKMEKLVLPPSKDIHNSLDLKIFGIMFRNLKSLGYAQRWRWIQRYEVEYNSRYPAWLWRRMCFLMWPKLETIGKKEVNAGPNRFGREKIFTRPHML